LAKPQEPGVMGVYAVIPNVSHPSPLTAFSPQTHTKSGRTQFSRYAWISPNVVYTTPNGITNFAFGYVPASNGS
jgi:hypothetical protein